MNSTEESTELATRRVRPAPFHSAIPVSVAPPCQWLRLPRRTPERSPIRSATPPALPEGGHAQRPVELGCAVPAPALGYAAATLRTGLRPSTGMRPSPQPVVLA